MTELDLYLQCIPMIAEMVVECRKLSVQQYEEWKKKTIETAPDTVKEFIIKVFTVISAELEQTGKRYDAQDRNIDYVRKLDAKELSQFINETCDCNKCPAVCLSNEKCESNIERWLLATRQ